jgi:hypothetical protein
LNATPLLAARADWPSFEGDGWAATREKLHLVSQMLGKLRLALAPPLPEWFHTPLALSPRGLTTRALPLDDRSIEASLDVVDQVVRLTASDGRDETVELRPARSVASIWTDYRGALLRLGVKADLWDKPQERADARPFSLDDRPRSYEPGLAAAWFALQTEIHWIFDAWRSPFFGRSGVNFWWGGFDLTVTLYNGRRAVPPRGSDYLMRSDLDAEHLSIGFWPGDAGNEARFFAYLVPEPANCAAYPFEVASAAWATTFSEWVLPYEVARQAGDRHDILRQFMDTVYRAAGDLAGWHLEDHTYTAPPPAPGRARDRG